MNCDLESSPKVKVTEQQKSNEQPMTPLMSENEMEEFKNISEEAKKQIQDLKSKIKDLKTMWQIHLKVNLNTLLLLL